MVSHLAAQAVFKKVLLNGLVVLVRPVGHVPLVSTQLWYHVGSKNELLGEKGNAHLIEHMLFKGTSTLSETDLTAIVKKLSGSCNAFTSYDYTAYVFEFPSQHWKAALAISADTMRNARFEEQMLNSELKAVIQELKMNRDSYFKALWQAIMSAVFTDHPYHYPVIGFKQDLWNLKRDDLFAFYHKHYIPNNATLVVVGDVDPEEVFAEAEKAFGAIPKDPTYTRKEFYRGRDLLAQSVVIYRDIQQPYGIFSYVFPGLKDNKRFEIDVLASLLGDGKDARLRKKIVDDLQLATEFSVFPLSLEDATLFVFYICAKDEEALERIRVLIQDELQDIMHNGIEKTELARTVKKVKTALITRLESNYAQAQMIGESYITTGNENFVFEMLASPHTDLEKNIQSILKEHALTSLMHAGKVLPLTAQGKEQWAELQKLSDQEDARILDGRIRIIPTEDPLHVHTIPVQKAKDFVFGKPEKYFLSNGLKVLHYHNGATPKIQLILDLYAQTYHEPDQLPGLYDVVTKMMLEGTQKYPGHLFGKALQDNGIQLSVAEGRIAVSMLTEDFEKGLELLHEVVANATLDFNALEKIKAIALAESKMNWDQPQIQALKLISDNLYNNHPLGKLGIATPESLDAISHKDVVDFYTNHITAYKARIAVVGDCAGYNVKQLLEKYLGSWSNKEIQKIELPDLYPLQAKTVTHVMARDQVVVMFMGRSIRRTDADFDKLQLFDQILSGGMSSRLFNLREQTGLFYTIQGSLVHGSDENPGAVRIMTIVSVDKLEAAKMLIKDSLRTMVDTITQEELVLAKQLVISNLVNFFSLNSVMANTFLFLDKCDFPDTFFDTRAQTINAITLEEVKAAACKVLDLDKMVTVQVGRVGSEGN